MGEKKPIDSVQPLSDDELDDAVGGVGVTPLSFGGPTGAAS